MAKSPAGLLTKTTATVGRLRLVRSGDELYYLVAGDPDPAFRFLKMYRFGAADLKRVGINATTGDEKAELDLRITNLLIRTRSTASTVPAKIALAMHSFACLNCSKSLKAKVSLAGKRVKCTRCGAAVPVSV